MRISVGEVRLNSKTGYTVLEPLRRPLVYFERLVEAKQIPAGKKYKIERLLRAYLDQAALAEVAIRYEDFLLTRLVGNGAISQQAADSERLELAVYAEAKRRAAALLASKWLGILENIAQLRDRGGGKAARLLPNEEDVRDWAVCAHAAEMTVLKHPGRKDDEPDLMFAELPDAVRSAVEQGTLPRRYRDPAQDAEWHHRRIEAKARKWLKPDVA